MLKLITGDAHTLPAIAVLHLLRSTTAQMQEDLTTRRLHGSCISSGECVGHRHDTTNVAAPQVAVAAPQVSGGGYSLGLGFLWKGKEEEDGEEHGWGMD